MGDNKKDKDLGTDYSGPGATMGIIIAINAPQLGLSIWHLAYNAFLTRLHMAREWATFSTAYRPLRVTSPQGRQVSTYRLQLPYRYSIPSLFASAILHWLMANAFYVFVSRGSMCSISPRIMECEMEHVLTTSFLQVTSIEAATRTGGRWAGVTTISFHRTRSYPCATQRVRPW